MQYHFLPYGCPVVLAPFIMMAILSPLSVVSFLPWIKCLYIHGFWTWPSCFIFFHHPLKTYFEKFHCGPKGKKSWKTPWIILWLRVRAIKFRDGYLQSNAQFFMGSSFKSTGLPSAISGICRNYSFFLPTIIALLLQILFYQISRTFWKAGHLLLRASYLTFRGH